jgi:hypothetical protein
MSDDRERRRSQSPADSGGSAPPHQTADSPFDRDGHLAAELLSRFLDEPGSFPSAERDVIERHLASCEDCRTALAELDGIVFALRALPQVAPPRSFALAPGQVRGQQPVVLHETPQWIERLLPRVRAVAAVAALLFVCVLGADVLSGLSGAGDDDDDSSFAIQRESQPTTAAAAAQVTATTAGAAAAPTAAAATGGGATPTDEAIALTMATEQAEEAADTAAAAEPTATTAAAQATPVPEGTSAPEPTTATGGAEQATATTGATAAEATATATATATPTPAGTPTSVPIPTPTASPTAVAELVAPESTATPLPEISGVVVRDEEDGGRDGWRVLEVGLAVVFVAALAAMIALPRLGRRSRR